MADNTTDLPEGTDKVISGASETSSPNSGAIGAGTGQGGTGAPGGGTGSDTGLIVDAEVVTATDVPASGDTSGGTGAGGTGGTGGATNLRDRVRSGTERLSGQAGEKARGLVSQGLERSAEALGSVSRMIGETATGLDERLGEEYGEYARRAAGAIESTANSLASKDPDELIDDAREFVRRSPGIAVAGAAIVGFVVARLVKSGLARDDEDGDARGSSGSSRKA